ncbi:hypothetical protein JAAARDRAFT_58400 [Jaapia argillacea MUCL 33604]|uniref:Ribosomal protein S5 domain 2-like protein n=1 Tax=Jaapia argillacea MUCL 33604 TaxID=933084 RepID=A0A067PSU4_9AGAM|nr:hypothetical protein JAAARDRAFT_58400 [Jaapia argillacea MUCL 33604]
MNLNILRSQVRRRVVPALARPYATAFDSPGSLEDADPRNARPGRGGLSGRGRGGRGRGGRGREGGRESGDKEKGWAAPLVKPESPSFFTGRAAYFDHVLALEEAVVGTRSALKTLQLLPLPSFARASVEPYPTVWASKEDMGDILGGKLTTTRYRRVSVLLNQLNEYRSISNTAGCIELTAGISDLLSAFERANMEAVLMRGKRKPVEFDEYGRTYTIGRRKTSSARCWMIPVQPKNEPTPSSPHPLWITSDDDGLASLGLPSQNPVEVTSSQILINNIPLSEFFPLPADRERIVRPMKIAGLIGAYNVFAIVRGGGTTGQSGAVALAVAKGLAAHVPDVEFMLRRAKLLRRDPRMVERKKTGLAKSRKAYSWVKR